MATKRLQTKKTPRTSRGVSEDAASVCLGLANTILTQGVRGEIRGTGGETEVIRRLLFVLHAQCQVTARLQVIQSFQGVPRHLDVVIVLGVSFRHTPELITTVVVVDHRRLPGVLVDVEVTFGV